MEEFWKMEMMPVILFFYISLNFTATENQTIPNNLLFEKVEYQIFNKTLIKDPKLKWKTVAPNVVIFNASVTITEPIKEIWVHIVLYYKWREYRQYLVNLWIEYCSHMDTPAKHPLAQKIFDNFLNVRDHFDLNFDVHCPFFGNLTSRTIRPFNISNIVVPLMQSGRYRVNLMLSPHQNGPVYAAVQYYVSISDFRVWF